MRSRRLGGDASWITWLTKKHAALPSPFAIKPVDVQHAPSALHGAPRPARALADCLIRHRAEQSFFLSGPGPSGFRWPRPTTPVRVTHPLAGLLAQAPAAVRTFQLGHNL